MGVLSDAVENRSTRNPRSRAYAMRCAMSAVAIPFRRHRGATRPPSSHASVGDTTVSFPIPTIRPPDSATKKGPVRWVTQLPTDRRSRAADPEIGATHATIADEHSRDHPRGRGRDREADALRRGDDRRVDADDFGVGVDERTPGVSRVQRGVRLDHVLDESAIPRGERSTKRAHDTGRDGRVEAKRIADRDHELTDP